MEDFLECCHCGNHGTLQRTNEEPMRDDYNDIERQYRCTDCKKLCWIADSDYYAAMQEFDANDDERW